jgi:hypothetical protein
MKSSYRILKLSSGEEIIAKIIGKDNDKIVLENPMVFRTTHKPDMFGQTKEVTFLGDWLANTSSKVTKISENFIMNWLTPSKEVAHLYDMEQTRRSDRSPKPRKHPDNQWPKLGNSNAKPNNLNDPDIFSMLDELMKDTSNTDKNDQYVFMHMMLPPDALKEMMESGIFDEIEDDILSQMGDDIEDGVYGEMNDDLYTGDDTTSPEYGNRWTDWDPDPFNEDYN